MFKNFQRNFRYYLATFLCGLLLVGVRWQAAPLGTSKPEKEPTTTSTPAARPASAKTAAVAIL